MRRKIIFSVLLVLSVIPVLLAPAVSSQSYTTNTNYASTDVQATLLSFLGQQAIAHAATIFATLAAAFTFAQAIGKKKPIGTFSVFILNLLFAFAIYAALRLYYYGILWGKVLTTPAFPIGATLTDYWSQIGTSHTIISVTLGVGSTFPSFLLGPWICNSSRCLSIL